VTTPRFRLAGCEASRFRRRKATRRAISRMSWSSGAMTSGT